MKNFSVYIPEKRKSTLLLERETGLSLEILKIFNQFYGLKKISIYDKGNHFSLLKMAIDSINLSDVKIDYLFYLHTADWVSPHGASLLNNIKRHYKLKVNYSYEVSYTRCVSYFSTLDILDKMFSKLNDKTALIITGEIAFTEQLRVVPQSSLTSDAATAALWSSERSSHNLLSVVNRFMEGFAKGIYLSKTELSYFDECFIQEMMLTIRQAIEKAKVSLQHIKLLLPHNVNIPTWLKIANALEVDSSRVYLKNIPELGHAFCSDHLINLQGALSDQLLQPGDYYVMAGCGLGFTLSAAVFQY